MPNRSPLYVYYQCADNHQTGLFAECSVGLAFRTQKYDNEANTESVTVAGCRLYKNETRKCMDVRSYISLVLCTILASPLFAQVPAAPAALGKEKPTTQDPIVQGCVTVSDIHWQTDEHAPGIGATVISQCSVDANVHITIAYFDKRGEQLGTLSQHEVLPPNHRLSFHQDAWFLLTGKCDSCDSKSWRLDHET
jgi:hypothetical protein